MFLPYYRIVQRKEFSNGKSFEIKWYHRIFNIISITNWDYIIGESILNTIGEKHEEVQRFNPYTDIYYNSILFGFRGKNYHFYKKGFGKIMYWIFKSR